ncbi:MAG: hypothetical protein M3Y72_21380, partial [Acidobacteriota bacterium]|nr:hypothetical protein [Acidobacteriota bacterium]
LCSFLCGLWNIASYQQKRGLIYSYFAANELNVGIGPCISRTVQGATALIGAAHLRNSHL